jgi:ABC-type phosphate transport system substrate-binding protein
MSRAHWSGASVAAALTCLGTAAFANQGIIAGGGSTLAQFDYIAEQAQYNAGTTLTEATFSTYWTAGSGTGQKAFLDDDLSCDINRVTGANGGNCNGGASVGAPGNTVQYGASEAVLSSAQIAAWATSAWGQSLAGNLIQLPSMGVGIAIPVNDSNITANGQATFSDNDLCGIFSGLITDFSQITDSTTAPAAGQFQLLYRADGSGTTFLLTNHLSAVCNTSNTNAGVTFTATTVFASLFSGLGGIAAIIPNAVGAQGSDGIANYMAGLSNGPVPQAIGYLSPDYTTVDPLSFVTLSNNLPSPLVVAAVYNGITPELPTTAAIATALVNPLTGINLTPPSNAAQGANPALWVPQIQTVSQGYPIVGYTTFAFAQCYSDPTVTSSVKRFLRMHLRALPPYGTDQADNGFVRVPNSPSARWRRAIRQNLIRNINGWNINIGNATACAGLTGR